ncbi:MAG: HAMP domain-containing protein [Candidatus Sericytochromatia bacterium]|nr:HAMP domain-containing protein [Candidatus Tanganyikabacteria bacterium]
MISSLRARLSILFGVILLAFGLAADHVARDELRKALVVKLEQRGVTIARDVAMMAGDALMAGDEYLIAKILSRTKANNPDARYLVVQDRSGRVIASTFGRLMPRGLLDANEAPDKGPWRFRRIGTEEGLIRDFAVKIPGFGGSVRVGMSDDSLKAALANYSSSVSSTMIAVLVAGLLVTFGLAGFLTAPLQELAAAVRSVGQGNFSETIPSPDSGEVGQLAAEFNTMTRSLAEKEASRQALLKKVITSQEEERRRVARELHDDLAQVLTYVILRLEELDGRVANMDLDSRAALGHARQALDRSLAETRRLITDLRPTVLDDLGLVAALRSYAESRLGPVGCQVDFQARNLNGGLDYTVETAVFRIVQEAINNIARHSGARNAQIALRAEAECLRGEVIDDGCGYLNSQRSGKVSELSGLGLQGMQERASLLGGSLEIRPRLGGGTQVTFDVPLGAGR